MRTFVHATITRIVAVSQNEQEILSHCGIKHSDLNHLFRSLQDCFKSSSSKLQVQKFFEKVISIAPTKLHCSVYLQTQPTWHCKSTDILSQYVKVGSARPPKTLNADLRCLELLIGNTSLFKHYSSRMSTTVRVTWNQVIFSPVWSRLTVLRKSECSCWCYVEIQESKPRNREIFKK